MLYSFSNMTYKMASACFQTAEAKLGLVCAAIVAGAACGISARSMSSAWPVVGFVTLLVATFGFARSWRHWHIAFFLLLGLTLAMRATDARQTAWREIELQNGRCERSFEVTDEPRIGAPDRTGHRWISIPSSLVGEKVFIVMRQSATDAPPQVGEVWRCAGWLGRGQKESHRAMRLWIKGRSAFAQRERAADPHALKMLLARARRDLSRRIGIGLADRPLVADLNRAMILGERASLPWDMRQTFVKSGTIHVFAISGLHVMIVAHILLCAIVMTLFPLRWAGLLLIPVLWLYILLIGTPPSAVRAAAMASVYYVAPIFWRRSNSLTSWEVSLIGFALVDPIGLFGVGSMLSFTVMLGILLFLRWAKPFASHAVTGFGVPFAAWAAGVPIAAHVFARITPGGLLANLAMVPLACGAVLTSVMGVMTSYVSERLAAHVNNLAALFTEAMAGISWSVSKIPGADFEIQPWNGALCVAWYAGIVLLFVWIKMVWLRRRSALV